MASLLRGKQAGIQHDLSTGLDSTIFQLDDVARFGVNSQVAHLAYDPVQSLLAVGTKSSSFGPGQIYVFGRGRIQTILQLPQRGASVSVLQFCADKLLCLDSKHALSIFSLELKRLITSYSALGVVTSICSDPMLDYVFLGMETGDITAYDIDRGGPAPFKVPMLLQQVDPRTRISPVVSLQLHPRDVGTLLVGYTDGAAIYSFKLNKSLRFFHYEIPRGAPGGDTNPAQMNVNRRPRLTKAVWHPTGTFILTSHEDGSLAFWDTMKDGRLVMARTLTDTNVATPGSARGPSGMPGAGREPLFDIAWCANQDPEDTAILVAGGAMKDSPQKGLTLFEMGRTPVYATSSWDIFTTYFASPKHVRILPTPPGAKVIKFCLIPRSSPHFAGANDPIAVIALLSSGELLTLTFPSGVPITPTNQLPISLTFVHPFMKRLGISQLSREKWLGLQEKRQSGPALLNGGAEGGAPLRRFERRNIVHTAYADGTVRLWDPGYGDEIENPKLLQIDVGRAVGRPQNIDIVKTSFAGESTEFAVGLSSGEVVVFRWGFNRNAGKEPPPPRPNQPKALTAITDRAEPHLSEGLLPLTLLDQKDGPVTAIATSDIGFVAAGFEGGALVIIDLRGPAIIYNSSTQDILRQQSKGSFRRRGNSNAGSKPDFATCIAVSIMTIEGDDYSSILCHVGTHQGSVATFKILPDPSGRHTVQFAGSVSLEGKVVSVAPINTDKGSPANASQQAMAGLRNGARVNGALVAVTESNLHIFKPASAKGAHKSFDNCFCDAAAVARYHDQGYAVVGLFGDGNARAYSIPSLKEIGSINVTKVLDARRFGDAVIASTGNILGFTGPSEVAWIDVWGTGESSSQGHDMLFNPAAMIPPRPTISNVQWITGTQYVTPADMDVLIGGPNRPPSKRMIEQARAEEEQRRQAGRSGVGTPAAFQQDEGYWAYMQRQLQERTEKLGIIGDSMENLEQNSANWLEDVNKFVGRQKRSAATGLIKARFGF